jgi:hypothetical protein
MKRNGAPAARRFLWLVAASLAMFASAAHAETITLTFEGLANNEPVADYYNGGNGGFGTGPGPNYGVTFGSYALASIPSTPYPGDPSPPTVLLLSNSLAAPGSPATTTMDVQGGFSQFLAFYYIYIGSTTATVQVYSGLDGSGTLLGKETLPSGPAAFAPSPNVIDFSGIAQSVVFAGGNGQLAFDNISFQNSVPEPESCAQLLIGCVFVYGASRWRRTGRRGR